MYCLLVFEFLLRCRYFLGCRSWNVSYNFDIKLVCGISQYNLVSLTHSLFWQVYVACCSLFASKFDCWRKIILFVNLPKWLISFSLVVHIENHPASRAFLSLARFWLSKEKGKRRLCMLAGWSKTCRQWNISSGQVSGGVLWNRCFSTWSMKMTLKAFAILASIAMRESASFCAFGVSKRTPQYNSSIVRLILTFWKYICESCKFI